MDDQPSPAEDDDDELSSQGGEETDPKQQQQRLRGAQRRKKLKPSKDKVKRLRFRYALAAQADDEEECVNADYQAHFAPLLGAEVFSKVKSALSLSPGDDSQSANMQACRALSKHVKAGQTVLDLRHCQDQPWAGEELLCNSVRASVLALVTNAKDKSAPGLIGLCSRKGRIDEDLAVEDFDHAVVQAPCSLDGTFARDPQLWGKWKASRAAMLQPLQRLYLLEAIRRTRVGGYISWCVASLNLSEGPDLISQVCSSGLTRVVEASTFLPHITRGDGCYVALLCVTNRNVPAWPSLADLAAAWDVYNKLGGGSRCKSGGGGGGGVELNAEDTEAFVAWCGSSASSSAPKQLVLRAGPRLALAMTSAVAAWAGDTRGKIIARRVAGIEEGEWLLEPDAGALLVDELRIKRNVKVSSDTMRSLQAGETSPIATAAAAAAAEDARRAHGTEGVVLVWCEAKPSKAERKRGSVAGKRIYAPGRIEKGTLCLISR